VLQDLDIDPARVALRYEAVGYDPFIEQIGLAISRELTAETSAGRLLMESLSQSLSAHRARSCGRNGTLCRSLDPISGKSWQAERPTPHDLRRTLATRLAELGIVKEDRDAVLNHTSGDVGKKNYDLLRSRARETSGAGIDARDDH
jgi:integrase